MEYACLAKRMRTEAGGVAVFVEQGEDVCAHWGVVAAGTAITHAPTHGDEDLMQLVEIGRAM